MAGALGQTHPDVEVIAVDDGSTDDTLAVLQALKEQHPDRLTVIAQAHAGAGAARNAGMAASTGTYLQFLDADDTIHPEKIAHQLRLAKAEGADVVIGSAAVYPVHGGMRHEVQRVTGRDPWFALMAHALGRTSQHLWRRSAVEAVGGWEGALRSSQEYELLFRMMRAGAHLVFDAAVLTDIHQRPDGISGSNLVGNLVRNIELRTRILDHLRSLNDGRDLQPYIQVLFDCVRDLCNHAPNEGRRMHDALIPPDFRPMPSTATGRAYVTAHRVLGFHRTEKLRALLRKR